MKKFLTWAITVLFCTAIPVLNAAPSPWDSWRSGYTSCEQAERQFERGNYTEALSLFEKSKKHYYDVRSARPDWNQRVIAERISECDRRISEVKRLLGAMKNRKRPASVSQTAAGKNVKKELKPGDTIDIAIHDTAKDSGEVVTDILDTAAVLELRSTLNRRQKELADNKKAMVELRSKLLESRAELAALRKTQNAQRNFEQEIANLMRDRRIAQEKYALLEARCKKLEADSVQPNLQLEEIKKRLLEERISLEQERKRAASAETALQQAENLARDNQLARQAAEKVMARERRDLERLRTEIGDLQRRLQMNDSKIAELNGELERSRKHNAELNEAIKRGVASQESAIAGKLAAEKEKKAVDSARKNAELARKNAIAEKLAAEKLAREQQLAREAAVADKDKAEKLAREQQLAREAALAGKDKAEKLVREQQSALNVAVTEKEAAIAGRNIAIAEKEAAIAGRNVAIAEKETALAERNAAVAERNAAVAEKNAAVAEKNAALAEKKAALAEHGSAMVVIAGLRKDISDRDSRLAVFKKMLADSEQKSAALKEALKLEKSQIENMNSEFERGRAALNRTMQENESLRKRNAGLENDVKEIAGRNELLKKRLDARDSADFRNAAAARETCRKLEKDLLTLQNELVVIRNNSNTASAKISDFERKLKAAEAELKESRTKEIALTALKDQHENEIKRLRDVENEFASLKRNFDALSNENRENRALLAAAKPREKELARVKLRLLELDRLKAALTREQQLNEDLRSGSRRLTEEVRNLRGRAAELDSLRRKLAELEGTRRELEQLKNLQKEYDRLAAVEPELAKFKIRNRELELQLKERDSKLETLKENLTDSIRKRQNLEKEITSVRSELTNKQELEAMISTQNSEIDRLNAMIKRLRSGDDSVMPAEYRRQINDLRRTAATIGPLNDRLTRLQKEYDAQKEQLSGRIEQLTRQCEAAEEFSRRRGEEIAVLRKLNAELAEMNRNSSAALKNKVEQAQLDRLRAEIAAMNKLYTEVTAERDRLNSEIDAIRRGAAPETPAVKITESPEELAGAGLVAERNGNMELAIWNYRQALLADENFRPAHLRLGHILYERGDYAGALPHLSSARTGGKFNLELAIRTARCQIALKRFGNAKSIVEPLLKSHAGNHQLQLLAGLIENGSGSALAAEERMITAIRLAPQSSEALIELSRLLADSVVDRKGEAVLYYERARAAGAAPVPELEKKLASLLDNRREMIRFLSGAATEAEIGGDHASAVWYYRKLVGMKPETYTPRLALALHRSKQTAKARETLEFNKPTRLGMVVLTIIENDSGNETASLRAARQCAGAKLPDDWQALTMELARLRTLSRPTAAIRMLLSEFQKAVY